MFKFAWWCGGRAEEIQQVYCWSSSWSCHMQKPPCRRSEPAFEDWKGSASSTIRNGDGWFRDAQGADDGAIERRKCGKVRLCARHLYMDAQSRLLFLSTAQGRGLSACLIGVGFAPDMSIMHVASLCREDMTCDLLGSVVVHSTQVFSLTTTTFSPDRHLQHSQQ
jgi:hypothetical protein